MSKTNELTNRIISEYGTQAMREVWIEELLELASKLQRSKRHEVTTTAIITEIADVSFVIKQMQVVFGRDECLAEEAFKVARTEKRLFPT